MKKSSLENFLFNTDLATNENQGIDKTKTTNVNILLNRVRLDKKRVFRKKIISLSLLVLVVSAMVFFAIT